MRIFWVVDLPAPLGPRKPKTSPGATVKPRPGHRRRGGAGVGEAQVGDLDHFVPGRRRPSLAAAYRRRTYLPRSPRLRRQVDRPVLGHLVLRRLPLGDAERSPPRTDEVFGQEHDLADVVGVMGELTLDRLEDGVWFAADDDRASEVGRGERLERGKQGAPIPPPSGPSAPPWCPRRRARTRCRAGDRASRRRWSESRSSASACSRPCASSPARCYWPRDRSAGTGPCRTPARSPPRPAAGTCGAEGGRRRDRDRRTSCRASLARRRGWSAW